MVNITNFVISLENTEWKESSIFYRIIHDLLSNSGFGWKSHYQKRQRSKKLVGGNTMEKMCSIQEAGI